MFATWQPWWDLVILAATVLIATPIFRWMLRREDR